jgi:translation initiation factor 2 beta subunit (eIF-2beta)/eIF-5
VAGPEYLICLECESPTYAFEWEEGRLLEASCGLCGNDDPAMFASEEEYEELSAPAVEDEDVED